MVKKIAQFTPTKQQRQWVDDECERTNESQATVMRKLIQEKANQGRHGIICYRVYDNDTDDSLFRHTYTKPDPSLKLKVESFIEYDCH